MRISIFEPVPANHYMAGGGQWDANGTLFLNNVFFPGSISLNSLAFLLNAATAGGGATSASYTMSLGLYSKSGATLSLANSASTSNTGNAEHLIWVTASLSATQDITPGNWYYAYIFSASEAGDKSS